MYDDQLEFIRNKLDDFIFIENPKKEGINHLDNRNENCNPDSQDNYTKNQRFSLPEQLDYMLQPSLNYFPQDKPNPLIYNSNIKPVIKKKGKMQRNSSVKSKNSKNKTIFQSKTSNNPSKNSVKLKNHNNINNNINNYNKNFNFNSNGVGLFDPSIKKNELGLNRRQEVIKQERLDKIKNYNLKFGKKVENIQMYNNVEDMIEGRFF